MKYNPHTGCVTGQTERAEFIAAIKATKDGAVITHLTITPTDPKRDINYPALQSIKLTEIRNTFRKWHMENL